MTTPIADFVREYAQKGGARLHMPGHKGRGALGFEALDITEIRGADALYEASGIIAESERNAASLFGTGSTFFSTEGSSQCIRAMLYLALNCRAKGTLPVVVAARNVHKSFVHAAALLDFDIVWLESESSTSVCSCPVSPEGLERVLTAMPSPPTAVYITSPDYLGGQADIEAIARICHRRGTILAVDNAHGAYLHFLKTPAHPMDLGADICCDSAHKTLPVLTGGAYLHIAKNAPSAFAERAKQALGLFGSTSPSYLTLVSLDECNRYLAQGYRDRLAGAAELVDITKKALAQNGWQTEPSDPLRITVRATAEKTGAQLADVLRQSNIECEFADGDYLVLMATQENTEEELQSVVRALGENAAPPAVPAPLPTEMGERALSVRQAIFAPQESVPIAKSLGRICGAPTVSCPPAVPIVVSGERITAEAIELFRRYGIEKIDVVK
jgi:arginine/lysine/ornithine decarboxylase